MGILDTLNSLFSRSDNTSKKKKKTLSQKGGGKQKIQSAPTGSDTITLSAKSKGRKKSKEVHADPIDATALGFSISIKSDEDHAKKRGAIRISVNRLAVRIPRLKKILKVADISATGLGFLFEKPRIKGGVKLKVDLILNKKIVAKEIVCKVMRHEKGQVGCMFIELDRAQDDAVNKLVLLGQKQQAERKKAQKDKEFSPPT